MPQSTSALPRVREQLREQEGVLTEAQHDYTITLAALRREAGLAPGPAPDKLSQ